MQTDHAIPQASSHGLLACFLRGWELRTAQGSLSSQDRCQPRPDQPPELMLLSLSPSHPASHVILPEGTGTEPLARLLLFSQDPSRHRFEPDLIQTTGVRKGPWVSPTSSSSPLQLVCVPGVEWVSSHSEPVLGGIAMCFPEEETGSEGPPLVGRRSEQGVPDPKACVHNHCPVVHPCTLCKGTWGWRAPAPPHSPGQGPGAESLGGSRQAAPAKSGSLCRGHRMG